MQLKTSNTVFGGYSVGVTPVLIPNTEVKSYSADDTAWETVWESRSPPKLFEKPHSLIPGLGPFYSFFKYYEFLGGFYLITLYFSMEV